MKKLILLGGVFMLSLSCFAIQGYQMKPTECSDGTFYNACPYVPDADCNISEQTFCGEPGMGG